MRHLCLVQHHDYVEMAYNLYPAEPGGQDRISCYRNVLDNFTREFEGSHKFGLCIVFMFYPQVIGSPGRIQILESLLKNITEHEDVWIATGEEISDWHREHNNY